MTTRMPIRSAAAETMVRGSRFRAWLGPAADAGEAGAVLASRATAGRDATHHCWAYRVWLDERVEEAGFDAGEPGGTAGRPILGALQAADLIQAVCVVSRWFGGVKLGTGGLVRAYAEAARAAIDAAREAGAIADARRTVTFDIRFPYALSGAVQRVASRFGADASAGRYGESVELALRVPADRSAAFVRALADATAGAITARRGAVSLEPATAIPDNDRGAGFA